MPEQRRAVVYCVTRNLYRKIIPSMKSLLNNTRIDTVYVLAEDDELPWETPECVRVINVSNQEYFAHNGPNYNNVWTYMVLMRCALPKVLYWEDKVLSLDVDTLVQRDIGKLWDYDMNGFYLAAAKEVPKSREVGHPYYNFGVALLNLKMLRDTGMCDRIIWSINNRKYCFCEQDAYQEHCAGAIRELPGTYNHSHVSVQFDDEDIKIRHWPGHRGWYDYPEFKKWVMEEWKVKR